MNQVRNCLIYLQFYETAKGNQSSATVPGLLGHPLSDQCISALCAVAEVLWVVEVSAHPGLTLAD